MRLASLFSGGKDSCYAIYKAMPHHEISCLITIKSMNKDSYMFHTPNIDLTRLQAKAMGIPLIFCSSMGKKESELNDLQKALKLAKEKYKIVGIVTGAIESVYQASRIQKICYSLDLWCFNPLWKISQTKLLNELLKAGFKVIVSGVAGYPFDETWLGRPLNKAMAKELEILQEKYRVNPAGEGGETESLVLDAPFFKKKINIISAKKEYFNYNGIYHVLKAELVKKS